MHIARPMIATREHVRQLLTDASGKKGSQRFAPRFLLGEWEDVVDAWQLHTWKDYRDVKRLGRKTRLSEQQRLALWEVFELAKQGLTEQGLVTRAEMFSQLAEKLQTRRNPPFDFAVVDEAQDIGVAQLRFLSALGGGRPNALFFAGDLGQRIFQTPFSWKSLGVDVRGRSQTLRINYRTSHQIRMQADRLLGPEVSDVDGNVEDRRGTVSVFNGPEPDIRVFDGSEQETEAVSAWIAERISEGIRHIEGSLAAQVLILVQNRFEAWLAERGETSRNRTGALRSMRGLVEKLLPLANEQVLVLQPEAREGHYNDPDKAVIVRLSAILQRRIGDLYRLARDHKLAYAAADFHGFELAWSVNYLRAPSRYSHAKSELCVATDGLWVRCSAETPWGTDQFETAKIPLEGVVPVELLQNTTVELPAEIGRSALKPYAKRLRALKDVEDAFDLVSSAVYRIDGAVPDEHLALVDRLWFGDGPLSAARRALTEVESDLESWEHRLAAEQARLVKDVLGVGVGDDVITGSRGRVVRLRLEGTTVHVSEKAVNFHLWGMRCRKDGLPGKLQEYLVLSAENDLE